MTAQAHFGDARRRALASLSELLAGEAGVEKAVLGHDLFGLLRVILWLRPGADEQAIRARASEALAACGRFWTGEIWVRTAATSRADRTVYDAAWDEGITIPGVERLRVDDRTRTRTAWLPRFRDPAWSLGEGPPIVVFYSFKGGVGRTTSLAAFAIQRAREGERVLVIDFDLDAPGAGTLLPGDTGDSPRGLVDYLLEAPLGETRIEDYVHRCKRVSLVGDAGGEVLVMPAGRVDEDYLGKLSRLDLEIRGEEHPLGALLQEARRGPAPDWILVDSRAGLSPAAGLLLDGIAHLHVLLGTNSAQGQLGLRQVIRHLGEERIRRDLPPAKILVVQAMVVDIVDVEKVALAQFNAWLGETLRDHYALGDQEEPMALESPGRAIPIPYRPRLALFSSIDDVVPDLVVGPYQQLGDRILWPKQYADVHAKLREVAMARLTIGYQDLSDAVRLGLNMGRTNDVKRLGDLLRAISTAEHKARRPMLSAVVGHSTRYPEQVPLYPGTEFFECARAIGKLAPGAPEAAFFQEELEAVHQYWDGRGVAASANQSA